MRPFLWLPFLLLGLSAGCHRAASPRDAGPSWELALQTEPADPLYGQDTRFTLAVTTPDGKPVSGLSAEVHLEMSGMDMVTPPVVLSPAAAPGIYTGLARFPMAGDWNCHVQVKQGAASLEQVVHYKVG